jgi:hypothetical protein
MQGTACARACVGARRLWKGGKMWQIQRQVAQRGSNKGRQHAQRGRAGAQHGVMHDCGTVMEVQLGSFFNAKCLVTAQAAGCM